MPAPIPTLAGYIQFIYSTMGIPQTACPPDSEWVLWSYEQSINTVDDRVMSMPGPTYLIAVYNLAGDILVNWAPDQSGVYYPTDNPPNGEGAKLGYFAYLRKKWDLSGFIAGVIDASADGDTSQSMKVPKAFDDFLIGDLQNLKTPWGRQYLAIAQKIGSLWGIS